MTKRRLFMGLLGFLVIYLVYLLYIFVLSPKTNLKSIYLIPKDAVFIIESHQPVESWKRISESKAWQHVSKNDYIADLTENIQKGDVLFKNNHKLLEFFDDRSLYISVHMISPKEYGLFYTLDLKRIAKLKLLKTYLNTLLNEGYTLSKRQYHQHEILEVYDTQTKETMHLAFVENQLIASYTHTLVEAAIDQYLEPTIGRNLDFIQITQQVGYNDLFRMYVQYAYLDDYYKCFSDTPTDWIQNVSTNFLFSGFSFDIDDTSLITAKGATNIKFENENYLEALQKSGTASRTIPQLAPKSTALYVSYGFSSFKEFYNNFEETQKANNSEQFKAYEGGIEKVEKFLKIDIQENFVDWIGDEIALLQIKSAINSKKDDLALVLKIDDVDKAKTQLNFVVQQIRKKTPVKFKGVDYKGYSIQFLSIKGFFKMLLGQRFNDFDKPYFTIVDDYVVFSNSPNTLKQIINSYVTGETLVNDDTFTSFDAKFNKESSLYVYSNISLLYNTLNSFADPKTKQQLKNNKAYITCFPQVGFQMTPQDQLFNTQLVISYKETEESDLTQRSSVDKTPISKPKSKQETPDTIFKLKPIYPPDLNAKTYTKTSSSGAVLFTVALKDGQKHGKYEAFYPNGNKKLTGRFKDDKQVGTWRYFDEDGKLIRKKKF